MGIISTIVLIDCGDASHAGDDDDDAIFKHVNTFKPGNKNETINLNFIEYQLFEKCLNKNFSKLISLSAEFLQFLTVTFSFINHNN